MKAVVVKPAKTNRTGSEPSRRFSRRKVGKRNTFVSSRPLVVNAGRPTFLRAPQLSGPPIYLLDGMTQSNHIATGRFCRTAGRVLGKFCLVHP